MRSIIAGGLVLVLGGCAAQREIPRPQASSDGGRWDPIPIVDGKERPVARGASGVDYRRVRPSTGSTNPLLEGYIRKNDGGEFVVLEDGTRCEIDVEEQSETIGWNEGDRVLMRRSVSGGPSGLNDVLMINPGDGTKAHAQMSYGAMDEDEDEDEE